MMSDGNSDSSGDKQVRLESSISGGNIINTAMLIIAAVSGIIAGGVSIGSLEAKVESLEQLILRNQSLQVSRAAEVNSKIDKLTDAVAKIREDRAGDIWRYQTRPSERGTPRP